MDEREFTLTEHLGELRQRLFRALLGIVATTGVALIFAPQLLNYAVSPLETVLHERTRLDVALVYGEGASTLADALASRERVRLGAVVPNLTEMKRAAHQAAAAERPVDLVLVSSQILDVSGDLAFDVLDQINPPPEVAYLVRDDQSRLLNQLVLEGASVIRDPPRPAVLERVIRRAAAARGKSAGDDRLVVLSPLEPFFAYLKIAVAVGLFLACPIWLYQIWRFIEPGLYRRERNFVLPVVFSGSVLFLGGGLFAYFAMFPVMFDFLINEMMPANLASAFTVDRYLSLLLRLTLAFGLVFELPLALAMLAAVGIVDADSLKRFRKYFMVLAFVLGAFMTPADPLSQVMMAGPLILFYEIGIVLARIFARKDETDGTALEKTDTSA